MKKILTLLAIGAFISIQVGCANGPIRNLFRGSGCNTCQPPAEPNYGCANGVCGSSYLNDSYIQNDPYLSGSSYDGATINPPVFDSYGGANSGGTIVPSGNGGTLPSPTPGN